MALHLITGYAGREHITSADQGSFNLAMMGNGQFVLDRGRHFDANIQTNSTVRIYDGDILMQGRHIRLKENTFEDVNLSNGSQGMKRHDLIVVRYEKNSATGVEEATFRSITGIPHDSNPQDPEYITGDISELEGDLVNDMPMYRAILNGLTLEKIEPLFQTINTWKTIQDSVEEKCQEAIDQVISGSISTVANITIPATGSWQGADPAYIDISVAGVTGSKIVVDVNTSGDDWSANSNAIDAFSGLLGVRILQNNTLRFYFNSVPSISIPVSVLIIKR